MFVVFVLVVLVFGFKLVFYDVILMGFVMIFILLLVLFYFVEWLWYMSMIEVK